MKALFQRIYRFSGMLGPGMLFAAAAMGASHLIQSTRAGANYGFIMIFAVLLIALIKYPFFVYAERLTALTNKTLLQGYAQLGRWILLLYIIITVFVSFTTVATVSFITANIFAYMIGATISPLVFSIFIISICASIVFIGSYIWLERFVKSILVILAISTLTAVLLAFPDNVERVASAPHPDLWNLAGFSFILALMGWMPAPMEVSVWVSLWTKRRHRDSVTPPTPKEAMLDFNIGYIFSVVLAMIFVALGTLVMFGSGEYFSDSGVKFTEQLMTLYTSHIGLWSEPILEIAALTTMFSTTITCLDGYPRAISTATYLAFPHMKKYFPLMYWYSVLILFFGSIILSGFFVKNMTQLLDFATTIAFLLTPLFAFVNYKVITNPNIIPKESQPSRGMLYLGRFGILFLTAVSVAYLSWHFWA
jgi:Mn2+/Fe2+ NRAMP family transporter